MSTRIAPSLGLALFLAAPTAFAADPATRPALTPSVRDRADRLALQLPADTVGGDALRFVEDMPERLFPFGGPTPEQEARRSADARDRLLGCRPAAATPPAAQRVFDRLVAELPPHLRADAFVYRLTGLDRPERDACTTGGGQVYVTGPEADGLLADPARGEAALAFVLADEIGHNALGHTRRGWAWRDAVDAAASFVPVRAARSVLAAAAPDRFLYTPAEREDADLFALHLCRNAGFDADAVLDPARLAALERSSDKEEGQSADATLFRLRRLLMERDGRLDDETTHGLFLYDRDSGRLVRCGPGQIGPGERPIVFAHGLRATQYAFGAFLEDYAGRKELAGRPLLIFRYPNNESLSRCGEFLYREMRRCAAEPDKAFFVCHSAGGLVFRWYAEVLHGGFDRAVFLATPQGGTHMLGLKGLVDVGRFALDAQHGLDFAFADAFGEGRGWIARDLEPDSLFLRRLNREKPSVDKYQICYGQIFTFLEGIQVQFEFQTAMRLVEEPVAALVPFPDCAAHVRRGLHNAKLPAEITAGDLAVSAASAGGLSGVKATGFPLMHEAMRTDPLIVRHVLDVILQH